MEKIVKPENIYVRRKRLFSVISVLIFMAMGIFLALLVPLGLAETEDDRSALILISVCSGILFAICVLFTVLNFRNLFFPYLLMADEKGIHNYSGLFHFGLIEWKDIGAITKNVKFYDPDSYGFCLRLLLKDVKEFKKGLTFFKKVMLGFEHQKVKIYTLDSQVKKDELYVLLENMLSYYNAPENTVKINE